MVARAVFRVPGTVEHRHLAAGAAQANMLHSTPHFESNTAVNAGYVVSGNDVGHDGGDCEPGVNPDGTYNMQFIQDFIRNGIKQQILWAKSVARRYYGRRPKYNYWNGCSTGGRQGYLLAQELGDELDGIMANAPRIYWSQFQTAQVWGQIAMRQVAGGPVTPAKLEQARSSAVARVRRRRRG